MSRLSLALECMQVTYRHWESWINSKNPDTRRLAIKAKVYGLIAFDKVMLGGE